MFWIIERKNARGERSFMLWVIEKLEVLELSSQTVVQPAMDLSRFHFILSTALYFNGFC